MRATRLLADSERDTLILVSIAAVFAVAGAMSVRNIPMFMLAAVPAMSRLLPALQRIRRAKPAPAAAAVVLTIVAAGAVMFAWRERGAHLGWTPMSAPAVESVRRCEGPLFNGFADGGVLTWFVPDRRVFVDSRGVEAYPVDLLLRSRNADLFGDYTSLFTEFGITCAVVESGSIMSQRLSDDPSMRRHYLDHQWTVFHRQANRQADQD